MTSQPRTALVPAASVEAPLTAPLVFRALVLLAGGVVVVFLAGSIAELANSAAPGTGIGAFALALSAYVVSAALNFAVVFSSWRDQRAAEAVRAPDSPVLRLVIPYFSEDLGDPRDGGRTNFAEQLWIGELLKHKGSGVIELRGKARLPSWQVNTVDLELEDGRSFQIRARLRAVPWAEEGEDIVVGAFVELGELTRAMWRHGTVVRGFVSDDRGRRQAVRVEPMPGQLRVRPLGQTSG